MNRNRKILTNTLVFAIGNFGSKILAYVMVLVYTHYIGKQDLGYYDLILTTVALFQPLVLMSFDEGIYRWLISDNYNKQVVMSTCIKATGFTTSISTLLLLVFNYYFHFQYISLIVAFSISNIMYSMFQNVIRGLTKNRLYAGSGILNSFLLLAIELLCLIVFNLGIDGLLLSKIVANIITIIFIYIKEPLFHGFIKKSFDKAMAKSVFCYSMPLVPNQISWWIVNASDRYVILAVLGVAYNGIYTISNKFPTVITTITGIVYFALQETMIKEYNAEDRDEFYSSTFKNYYKLLFTLVCCAVPATKVIIEWFVSAEYCDAWRYTGFLYLSTVFSALSSFLGIGYQISKETKRSVASTVSAAVVNIVINIVFMKIIGLHAATLSTLIAYLSLFIIRIVHSRKYFTLKVNWLFFIALVGLSIIIIVVSYLSNAVLNIIFTIICGGAMLYINRSMITSVIRKKKV